MKAKLIILLAVLLNICVATAQQTYIEPIPKAVFILIDGVPADVVESVATPNIDDISETGAYARAYVGGEIGGPTESPTISAVGYQSLLTGTWANKHNVWDNDVAEPNYKFWDIFRIAKAHDEKLTTAIFSTWLDNRTKLIGDGLESAGGKKIDFHKDGYELDTDRFPHDEKRNYIRNIDGLVASEAAAHITSSGPTLSWVYLEYTDDVGHYLGDSEEQKQALRLTDQRIGLIWEAVKQRQREHKEDWLIVVTTDHGRDAKTGKDHGGQTERERTIWIASNSSRLNQRFQNRPGIVDILPSIATHLRLSIPDDIKQNLDGKSFIE